MFHDIAQLLANVFLIVVQKRITKFVNLFYRIGSEALIGLLSVPRTLFSQSLLDIEQTTKSRHLFFFRVHIGVFYYGKSNHFQLNFRNFATIYTNLLFKQKYIKWN